MKRFRTFSILSMLLIASAVCGMELVISEAAQGYWVNGTPGETWFITWSGNQGTIYGSDFEEIASFSTGSVEPYYIYAAGRDFDNDDNIEILYTVYSQTNYTMSVYLRDIATGETQLSHVGNANTSFYCYSYYNGNERFLLVNRMVGSEYDHCYIYRSGVQVSLDEGTVPQPPTVGLYPNPYFPTAGRSDLSLSFSLPEPRTVDVDVYNIRGQKVRTIASGMRLEKGEHRLTWDGRDEYGKSVASGAYIFSIRHGDKVLVKRNMLVR